MASINLLGPDLANVGVLYSTGGTVALQNPIAPGKSVVINAFPPGINVTVLGSITLGVDDKSATMNLTANLIGGVLSVCRPS
ncbi:hypothetical protein [Janibacter limosus]|uniref:hypothetical protein n=1 Tax=Janibacter limosus TaxID=53458 RepID=UPI0008361548|nr:hypothetical protein [Janibacter limosus]